MFFNSLNIPVYQFEKMYHKGKVIGKLRQVSKNDFANINEFARWRNANNRWFFNWATSTPESATKWLSEVIADPLRLFFIAEDLEGQMAGHVGLKNMNMAGHVVLKNINIETWKVELDNWLKNPDYHKIKHFNVFAIHSLYLWAFEEFKAFSIMARVLINNRKVIECHKELGFKITDYMPLVSVPSGNSIKWIETRNNSNIEAENYYLFMTMTEKDYKRRKKAEGY
jgi:RimJ/RimL family protein N-acetyltransferase